MDRRQAERRHQQVPVAVERRHGERRTYLRGCRCVTCRAANAAYIAARRASVPLPTAVVEAAPARAHLEHLRTKHVGTRRAHALSGVARSILLEVLAGRRLHLRPDTAARILAIPVRPALSVRVPATVTWRYIRLLLKDGFTKASIARALGLRRPTLDLHPRRVELRTHILIVRLYYTWVAEHPLEDHERTEEEAGRRP